MRSTMGICSLLSYAWSDLRDRKTSTALNILAVGLAVAYPLVLGFYGYIIFVSQQEILKETVPTRIVATTPEVANRQLRFTPETIKKISALPNVFFSYPAVEMNVKAWIEGSTPLDLPLSGICDQDPVAERSRLQSGSGFEPGDLKQAIVGSRLLGKLGGRSDGGDRKIIVEFSRSNAGKTEIERITLRICGILRHQVNDQILIPYNLARQIDLWCTSKSQSLSGKSDRIFPSALVYIDRTRSADMDSEAKRLQVRFVPVSAEMGVSPEGTASSQSLQCYRVQDLKRSDDMVAEDLLSLLALTKPLVTDIRPFLTVEGRLGKSEQAISMMATDVDDPIRNFTILKSGSWVSARNHLEGIEIVMPTVYTDSTQTATAAKYRIGDLLPIRFSRITQLGARETITINATIIGLTNSPSTFMPLDFLINVSDWQKGTKIYNEMRGNFEDPKAIDERSGTVRCNIFASSIAQVPAVVRELRSMGYQTEDRLADYRDLMRLGQVLTIFIIIFALGCAINGCLSVLITSLMHVRSRFRELGILRSLGAKTCDIIQIYASQGIIIGVVAFVCSGLVVTIVEPLLRLGLRSFVHLPKEAWEQFPTPVRLLWLDLIVIGIALGFSLIGTLVPAAMASRQRSVDLLGRQL